MVNPVDKVAADSDIMHCHHKHHVKKQQISLSAIARIDPLLEEIESKLSCVADKYDH